MVPSDPTCCQYRSMKRISPHWVAPGMLIVGLIIGTLANTRPPHAPRRVGDYWLLTGDFHVHASPGDGALGAWALGDEAARVGLDAIAVTNHDQLFAARIARWFARSDGPLVIVGQEITNPDYHLIAVGVERVVNAEQPAAAAIDDIHAQGGVAIAAHPGRRFRGYDDDRAVAQLDGSEIAHTAMLTDRQLREDLAAFFERARRLNPGIAPIGSSDFHASVGLGRCRTLLLVRERTVAGVLDAIRQAKTVATDANGRLYGDAGLLRLVEQSETQSDPPDSRWRRVSVMLAWLGALGIVMFRRAEPRCQAREDVWPLRG